MYGVARTSSSKQKLIAALEPDYVGSHVLLLPPKGSFHMNNISGGIPAKVFEFDKNTVTPKCQYIGTLSVHPKLEVTLLGPLAIILGETEGCQSVE